MRLGFLTTSFPRHDGDPAGSFVLGMARALAARGHAIEVLAAESDSVATEVADFPVRRVPYLRPRGLERLFYGAGAPENLGRDPLAWLGAAPFVASLGAHARALASRCDAIVSHWAVPCGLVGAIACPGLPHLVVCHGSDVHALARWPGGARLAAIVARRATSLLFVAETLRDLFLSLLPPALAADAAARAHVCPMGVDLPEAPPPDRRRRRGLSLLFLGRLVPLKGVSLLPRALAGMGGVRLTVAGDGPERASLARAFADRGVDARLVGVLGPREKAEALAAADALVHPARILPSGRTEGAPTAVLEAMASGLPIVATRVGGVPAIVRDGVEGLLVSPGAPDELRTAVGRIQDDVRLRRRLGRRALRRAQEFAWPTIAPRIEALLV